MSDFKWNEIPFDAKAAVEAANGKGYYLQFTMQQRAQIFNYLNSIAYNYPENEPPRMDRTVFSIRTRKK